MNSSAWEIKLLKKSQLHQIAEAEYFYENLTFLLTETNPYWIQ